MLYVDQAAFGAAVEAMLVCLTQAKDKDGLFLGFQPPMSGPLVKDGKINTDLGLYSPAADAVLRMMQDYAGRPVAISASVPA